MNQPPPESESGPSRFPPTQWSAIQGLRTKDETRRRRALERFLLAYYDALNAFVCQQFRLPEDEARDRVHDFILDRVIQRNLLVKADQTRGRFRTFLIQALNSHLIDAWRRERAARRSPKDPLVPIHDLEEPSLEHLNQSAQALFDLEFARGLLRQALARMKSRCRETGRDDLWRVLEERIIGTTLEGRASLPYRELGELIGAGTEAQVANLLTTAKRMFARVFKSVVRDYEADDAALETELKALRHILSNA